MPANWRLDDALAKLRDQLNHLYPGRSKAADGTIGDQAHSARSSDHNPNAQGVVKAMDITNDPKSGLSAGTLAEIIRLRRDNRIKYVIFNGRMFSSYVSNGRPAWVWRPYEGSNAHIQHVHISIKPDVTDDQTPWWLV